MPCENPTTAGSASTGTLRDIIAEDALTVFCNTNDFAETVVYYPRRGASRSIDVVIEREPAQPVAEDLGSHNIPIWRVHVANDATSGIASTELNLGGDQIALSPRDGQTPVKKSITQILLQDHGMLVLQCQ